MRRLDPLESDEQIVFFDWVHIMENSDPRFKMIYSVNNHQKLLRKAKDIYSIIARLKREGMRKGVLDIAVDVPQKYLGIWRPGMKIEMKRIGGKMTLEQSDFMMEAQRYGYLCHLCRTGQAAIDRTKEYFNLC